MKIYRRTPQPDVILDVARNRQFLVRTGSQCYEQMRREVVAKQARIEPHQEPSHIEQRVEAYRGAFTSDQVQEALFEFAAGRPEKLQALQAIRQQIKDKYPKPG